MTILLINPNSNPHVTAGFDDAVEPLRVPGAPAFEGMTLAEGPFGILTQHDVESVVLPLRRVVTERNDASVFVIACFSDPGLAVCREATHKPVLGIRECAVLSALAQGDRFGIIALGNASVARHGRAVREMGLTDRYSGALPLHLSVEAAEEAEAYPRVKEVGQALKDQGAETLILGCAGMVRHRAPLAADLDCPVIDPMQAAGIQAMGLALLSKG